jgi:N-hydroxyarylamine O-acetyltransferase
MKIVGIGGSLREKSLSRASLLEALSIASKQGAQTELLDMRALNLPLFLPDETVEAYLPEHQINIKRFLDVCRSSDAMIWASPTYHGTVSGAIKNAIDFIELMCNDRRPYLTGRAVGLITVADSTTLAAMRDSVHELRAWLAPTSVVLDAPDFTPDLNLKDGRPRRRIERMVNELIEFCSRRNADTGPMRSRDSTIDVDAYLNRIGYSGSRTPDAATLRALHLAHMLTVPFENLDIHLGRQILLDEAKFFEKIVTRGRGGFCYELNGLFAALLRCLNFDVTLLSARVYNGEKFGPEFDHMVLLVENEERQLADVGFGDSFIEPLRFDDPGEQVQGGIAYRIEREDNVCRMHQRHPGEEWRISYEFTLQPRRLADFCETCRWQQTSPESIFTQKRVCSVATPRGRITLSDMKLIVTENGNRTEQTLSEKEDFNEVLKRYFHFELT